MNIDQTLKSQSAPSVTGHSSPQSVVPSRSFIFYAALMFAVITGFSASWLAPQPHPQPLPEPAQTAAPNNPEIAALDDKTLDTIAPAAGQMTAGTPLPPQAAPVPGKPAIPATEPMQNTAPEITLAPEKNPALPPALPKTGTPRVAILVADLGGERSAAENAIATLPPQIALGFEPGDDIARLSVKARQDGHEIWLGVPMQPKKYPRIQPGRGALLLSQSADEQTRRLQNIVSALPEKPAGLYNIMGSAFTAQQNRMAAVAAFSQAKNLGFIDARSDIDAVGAAAVQAAQARAVRSRGFIDDDPAALPVRLQELVRAAKRDGEAVALITARPASLAALETWTQTLASEGVTLVTPGQLCR